METLTLDKEEFKEMQEPEKKEEKKVTNLLDKAMLVSIRMGWLPQTKTISNKVLTTTADPRMINNTKRLYDSLELKKIGNARASIANYLRYKSSPFPAKAGHFLIGVDLFNEVENRLMEHLTEETALVDAFVAVYDLAVQESEKLLGDQFNASDYPSKDTVKSYFTFEWSYEKFGINEKLEEMSKEAAERQETQFRRTINDAGIACEQLIAEQFLQLVNNFAEKLEPTGELNKDGSEKKRIIRDSLLGKITQFYADLPYRNITANPELELAGNEVRDMLSGKTVDEVRDDEALREDLRKGFANVKTILEGVKNQYGSHSQQVWNKITEESTVFRVMDKMDQGQEEV